MGLMFHSVEPRGAKLGHLSTWGYLIFLIWVVVMAVLAPGARVVAVLLLVSGFCVAFCRGSLRVFRRPQFWMLVASALLLGPLFIGEGDMVLFGVSLSRQGFWAGLWMTARATGIALALNGFSSVVSAAEMALLLERTGLKGLGFALGVAFNMMPIVQETMNTSTTAIRLRGGFRRDRFRSLKRLLVTVLAGSLRRGDDIVDSAKARAFDPTRAQGALPRAAGADVVLAVALLAFGMVILLV